MSGAQPKKAIVSYWADALLTGGASILLCLPYIIFGDGPNWLTPTSTLEPADWLTLRPYLYLAIFLNIPHFLASYRIVYRSPETILRYRGASIYVPLALIIYGGWALARVESDPMALALMATVAGIYLAWHYTGQAWGMIASFAFLDGTPLDAKERRLIKWALHILLAWHVTWFCHYGEDAPWILPNTVGKLYGVLSVLTLISVGLSVAAAVLFTRRTGRKPSLRMVLPWVAIYVWYAAMARTPFAIYFVQIAHAVQYLVFPARVESNRLDAAGKTRPRLRLLGYGAALIFFSWCITDVPDALIKRQLLDPIMGSAAAAALPAFILHFLNIHHFFTDSCIWKISNPTVRRELFAHVLPPPEPNAAPKPPPPGPTPEEVRRRRFRWAAVGIGFVVVVAVTEAAVRSTGRGAFKPLPSAPNEIVRLEADAERGWRNKPGTWTYPAYALSLPDITVTIDAAGARATGEVANATGEVIVLGGSFMHGHGLSDRETYASKLQLGLPNLEVRNHGTNGYGTYQALLLLEALSQSWARPPKAVVYGFGDFHSVRNVGWYQWLLGLQARDALGYGKAPYVTIGKNGNVDQHAPESYVAWPFRRSLALVAHGELLYMRARTAERHRRAEEVTQRLLAELNTVCASKGTKLLVAVLTRSPSYTAFLEAKGIPFVKVNHPNAKDPSTRVPGEGIHPNAEVNGYWAEKTLPVLTELLK